MLLLAGCDAAAPETDRPAFAGRWAGYLEAETRTVLGGQVVTAYDVYDVEMTLAQTEATVSGTGRLTSRRGRPDGPPAPFTVAGGLQQTCDAPGCRLRDSTLALILRFPAPAAFHTLGLTLDLSPDGRLLEGPACCAPDVYDAKAHLRR